MSASRLATQGLVEFRPRLCGSKAPDSIGGLVLGTAKVALWGISSRDLGSSLPEAAQEMAAGTSGCKA